jgi:argininosuccinate lyase
MSSFNLRAAATALILSASCAGASAQETEGLMRDQFFWLGEINKATAVINSQEGLLDPALAPRIAQGIRTVLENGAAEGARRPSTVISFEPLMIEAAGVEVTLLHAGRSSQDMHATYRAAILRDRLLELAEELNTTTRTLVDLADQHQGTIVPNYTNGVAAQPNSYGHYLLGHAAGLERDAQRIRETYARIDRSAMGTTVLNGTSWPLNRERMADYLGFAGTVDNAYDASQISSTEHPVEVGALVTSIALHAGHFVEDVMVQYAQPRPWILLQEGGGNTYVSSAMPQKRNPGILNDARGAASTAIATAFGPVLRAHNITPGQNDAKDVSANNEVIDNAVEVLQAWNEIVGALAIDPERALEELDSDWTASQEVADVLMREHALPFRAGHHFASEIVDFAKAENIRPSEFPYAEAQRIYAESLADMDLPSDELPMSEDEFRNALDPQVIIANRASAGGPQPAEMTRMLEAARGALDRQDTWVRERREHIDTSLARLDTDFEGLMDDAD